MWNKNTIHPYSLIGPYTLELELGYGIGHPFRSNLKGEPLLEPNVSPGATKKGSIMGSIATTEFVELDAG
jgi:hypothetical protein